MTVERLIAAAMATPDAGVRRRIMDQITVLTLVQKRIQCPATGAVLDVNRAIVVEVTKEGDTVPFGPYAGDAFGAHWGLDGHRAVADRMIENLEAHRQREIQAADALNNLRGPRPPDPALTYRALVGAELFSRGAEGEG